MDNSNGSKQLRESLRILERKLGIINDLQTSCCGVTLAQCHAIVEVGRTGIVSLNDLADLLGLDKSTMSRTINNLVVDELVLRESDEEDRRYLQIRLTTKGQKMFEEIEEATDLWCNRIYDSIPEAKRAALLESLNLLINAFIANKCCVNGEEGEKDGM